MRDIPMFTTENGAASLTLSQIPYSGKAYIRLQATLEPAALLRECVDFCRCAGAESIYAAGHIFLEKFPVHTQILRMTCPLSALPETDAALIPVQETTLEQWRQLYNEKMLSVDNASYMTASDADRMLKRGDGYFVHRGESLLGIGTVKDGKIGAMAAITAGAGADVVAALCHSIFSDLVTLEVASTNIRAIRLYERLRFIKTGVISTWYKIC